MTVDINMQTFNQLIDFESKNSDLYFAYIRNLEKYSTLLESNFEQACQEIFAAYDGLDSFDLRQYTIYFNDGDTCPFVYEIEMIYDDKDIDEMDNDEYKALPEDIQNFFLLVYESEAMKKTYGEDVQITYDREYGLRIRSYTDHQ